MRPELASSSWEGKPLIFLLVTLDEREQRPPQGFGATEAQAAMIELHGATRDGHSVLLRVWGLRPYLFAEEPKEGLASVLQALQALVGKGASVEVEAVEKTPLMHYQASAIRMLRISTASQLLLNKIRGALTKTGISLGGSLRWQPPCYEANVPPSLCFLVDLQASGGTWLEVPAGRFRLRPGSEGTSTAQIEADVHLSALTAHKAEGEWLHLAPLRLLSLHLTVVEGEEQSARCVVAAAAVLQVQGELEPLARRSWSVCGGEMNESQLLGCLARFIVDADPDVLVGYDLLNGHLSEFIARAAAAKRQEDLVLGRLRSTSTKAKSVVFETRQLGRHDTKAINVEGRLLFDILTVLEREHKLTSYSLSSLALTFLGETRMDLRPKVESGLAPHRLEEFALRDAAIALKLFQRQHVLFRYVEMARVTGVPIEFLLTRGQSIKVFSMLLRKARSHGYVLPPPPERRVSGEEGSYEGGAVLEPESGFYDEPVVTLDFASLYPSIMLKHNLCYSTMLPPGRSPPLPEFEEVPGLGHRFVTSKVRRGLIPMVLEELLAARAAAKKELKRVAASGGDEQLRAVLDGRQLALKISANSVYGFTGMSVGSLPCQEIAASVTAYGRQMIERTRDLIHSRFGSGTDQIEKAHVVYGDTDSVMIALGKGCSLAAAFEFGRHAAEVVSAEFGAPVKMEFEKVYFPFLLMSKKRYAGVAWSCPDDKTGGKLDFKGIEVVRRDWCLLVRQVVERSLQLLLKDRSREAAAAHVQETVASLRSGRVDLRLLVMTKQLVKSNAEDYSSRQLHVELAERMRKRDPTKAPRVGERVPFVYVASGLGPTACDKAEDPLYAVEHGLPIDAEYYIEHQLKQPLLRVFEHILEGGKVAAEQLLFRRSGNGTIIGAVSRGTTDRPKTGGLTAFVRARSRCLGCKALLPSAQGGDALCGECKAEPMRASEVMLSTLETLRPLEVDVAQLAAQCARCEGSFCQNLSRECANVDCPIFFRRLQSKRDLSVVQVSLEKLSLDW